MKLSRFVRIQIWISLAFITSWVLFFLITWLLGIDLEPKFAGLTSGATVGSHNTDWEILIVDLTKRDELWDRFDEASAQDRAEFYRAWVRVIHLIPQDQAAHVMSEVLRKRWPNRKPPQPPENELLLKGLEETLKKFRGEAWRVAKFLVREVKKSGPEDLEQRGLLESFIERLKILLHEHPLKHCLSGEEGQACAQVLAQEKSEMSQDTLWKFANSEEGRSRRRLVLILLAEGGDRRPRMVIRTLLGSGRQEDLLIALGLIQAYGAKQYVPELEELEAKVQVEEVRKEISLTLRQLR